VLRQLPNDVAPSGGGVVIVGASSGTNVATDGIEIMARNNGKTSTLFINNDGGDVKFGGAIDIGYEIVWDLCPEESARVYCPAGKRVLGGGCECGIDDVEDSYPLDNSWICHCSAHLDGLSWAYAICANVK
jgi:hypothetical protein